MIANQQNVARLQQITQKLNGRTQFSTTDNIQNPSVYYIEKGESMINKEKLCAQAAEIGIELDETALERLDKYAEYLVEVNKSVNLTRITEPEDIAVKHFFDSMTLLTAYEVPQNAAVADVGTGAGFPGMVLKICRPDIDLKMQNLNAD